MIFVVCTFVAVPITFTLQAQSIYRQQADSLKALLDKQPKEDESYVDRLLQLSKVYERIIPDSMGAVTEKALEIATNIGYLRGEAEAHKLNGIQQELTFAYDEALDNYHRSASIAIELGDQQLYANTLLDIGRINSIIEQYDSASGYFDQALILHQEMNNLRQIGVIYHELAIMSYFQARYDEAIANFLEALAYFKEVNDQEYVASIYSNLSGIYSQNEQYQEAISSSKRALLLYQELEILDGVRDCQANIGSFYLLRKEYDSALYFLDAALAEMEARNFRDGREATTADILLNKVRIFLAEEMTDKAAETLLRVEPLIESINRPGYELDFYRQSGNVFSLMGEYATAGRYYEKALDLLSQHSTAQREMDLYRDLSRHHERKGDFKTTISYLKRFEALEDSIFDKEKTDKIATLQTQFQVQEKELTINKLERQNLQNQVRAQASKRQRDLYLFLGILMLFILIALLYLYQLKSKANKKLVKADKEKEILLKEIHHRVKNNLQVVSSLLAVQAKDYDHPAIEEFVSNGRSRVQAMALVHQFLYDGGDNVLISYDQYLKLLTSSIFEFYGRENIQYQIEADAIYLDIDAAIPLGLIANEMITNSLKHAFAGSNGQIDISLSGNEKEVELIVKDNGKGIDQKDLEKANSFGLNLIKNLAKRLNGTLSFESDQGAKFRIIFPTNLGTS